MDLTGLNAAFPPARGQAPHHIWALNEDDTNLPAPPAIDIHLMQRLQPFEELPPEWPVYNGLDYLGVDEQFREEELNPEDEEQELGDEDDDADGEVMDMATSEHDQVVDDVSDEDADGEVMDKATSEHDQVDDVSLTRKRGDAVDNDLRLLQQIDTSLQFVPTMGLLNATPPEFGPVLEPRPQE